MWQFILLLLFDISVVTESLQSESFDVPKIQFSINLRGLLPSTPERARIVNGDVAAPGQFPWMVSLRLTRSSEHHCGGAMVTPEHVITAALCLVASTQQIVVFDPGHFFVVTGHVSNLEGGRNTGVLEIRLHPEFNPNFGLQNDIAILKLTTPVPFTATERPVPLPTSDPGVHSCVLSGWGATYFPSSVLPSQLQMAILRSMTRQTCLQSWSPSMILDSTLCAGGVLAEGSCIGDFGSPLVCKGELTGIASWGEFCANSRPDLYAKVFYFRNWIDQTIADLSTLGRIYAAQAKMATKKLEMY